MIVLGAVSVANLIVDGVTTRSLSDEKYVANRNDED